MAERGARLRMLRFTATACAVVALAAPAGCNDPLHEQRSFAGGSQGNSGGAGSGGHGGVSAFGGNGVGGSSAGTSVGGAGGSSATTVIYSSRICSDGIIERREGCDDGNTVFGDGCSQDCRLEFGYECPKEGEPCVPAHVCGDGVIMPGEACDDGNTLSDDGCSRDCQNVERGWYCRVAARSCTPICGDGLVMGGEPCDDGNTIDGDGCSRVCQLERCAAGVGASFSCDAGGTARPVCGDGIVTPDEECDCGDGSAPLPGGCPSANDDATYDGCTTRCTWGPHCGDGKVDVLLYEECDLGPLNGRTLDLNLQPIEDAGRVYCGRDCRIPFYF